jgi:hypothetical protein
MMLRMEQQPTDSVGERWQFAGVVQCLPAAGQGWRLAGVGHGAPATAGPLPADSRLIVDIVADGAASRELAVVAKAALHDAVLCRNAGQGTDWWLESGDDRWLLPAVRVFVHRDVGGEALAAIPPRKVPLGKRLFWSTLLTLLRTDAGRRWVRRRYGV